MSAKNVYKHITICLGKALMQQPDAVISQEASDPVYISIGYFDTMQICPLQAKSPGNWLREAYSRDNELSGGLAAGVFFKTVHCVALEGQDNDAFMQRRSPYLFVTFVQGRCSTVKTWEKDVLDYLGKNIGKPEGSEDGVSYAVYRSLALCDMAILWKADQMLPIMEKIQKVYCAPMIGDIHSIPAILREVILDPDSYTSIKDEPIPRVTIRYLVRNASEAYRFFEAQPPENAPLFTVGIEDITSVYDNMTTSQLRRILTNRLVNKERLEQFNKAFVESEMHLGAGLFEGKNSPDLSTDLYEYCDKLQKKFQNARGKLKDSGLIDNMDEPWMKAASELYYALSSLSFNILADGFCYLVLGAAALFCDKLEVLGTKPNSRQLRKIQRFLRGWGTLMEQVLRSDGKFSQQPSFTPPPLCDVPANLLEFYLAFTYFASVIMQGSAKGANKFPLMLVPKLCRRIKVESVFDENPPCDRVLYVDIPISLLYDPYIVLSYLTHEISHYAGDDWRLRRTRAEKYYDIWVNELAAEIGFTTESAKNRIKEVIAIPTDSEKLYFARLSREMQTQLEMELSNEATIKRWLEAEYGNGGFVEHCSWVESLNAIEQLKQSLYNFPVEPPGQFFDIMSEYHTLFRECYADVAAVYLLALDLDEYLGLASQEIELYKRTYEGRYEQYYLTVERWATVISVSFPEEMDDIRSFVHRKGENSRALELDGQFVEDIQACIGYMQGKLAPDEQTKDAFTRNYHRTDCIRKLKGYLVACRGRMLSATGTDEKLIKLRAAFRTVFSEDSIFSGACQEVIYMYRDAAMSEKCHQAKEPPEKDGTD